MRQQPANRDAGTERWVEPWPAFPALAAVLLLGSFLYVCLRVQPLLEYHSYGPFFYRHRAFFETFLDHPGGLVNYVGVFLAQSNGLNWLGALIFTLSQGAVLLTAHLCLARLTGRRAGFAILIPVFALLLLRNRYGCPTFPMSLGLILALAAGSAYLSLPWRSPWLGLACSGLVSNLLFLLAGVWSALLFAVLCGMFAIVRTWNWGAALGCVVLALAGPLFALGTQNLDMHGLINPWREPVNWLLAALLYASVPIAGAVLALLTPSRFGPPAVLLAFLLGSAAVWLTFDPGKKLLAQIDYAAASGRYDSVLTAARQARTMDHPAKVRLQLALYHTGRLPEDLFSFLNRVEDLPMKGIGADWRAQTQPLLELGLVNDAEHMAHEALEMEGNRPDLLRALAQINLLKNRPQAAQVFLNVLSLIPFQGVRANPAWPSVEPELPAAERAFLAGLRARLLTNDVPHDSVGPMLELLLACQPTNRMAFEYAMAHYLIALDLTRAVQHLSLLGNFNYGRIPRSYEEALLLYQQLARVQIEVANRIRPETVERFRQFREAGRLFQGTPEELAAMVSTFGDTYWYYYYANRIRKRAGEPEPPAP